MFDFDKLAAPFDAVVPLLRSGFVLHKKQYRGPAPDPEGWYDVTIQGNRYEILQLHNWAPQDYQNLDATFGYSYGGQIVFQNFDVAKRKWGKGLAAPLLFSHLETFHAIRAVVWEDGHVYYTEPNYADFKIFEVQQCFDAEQPLTGLKGVTPELRTLFLFHALQRDQQRAELARLKAEEDRARTAAEEQERMKQIPYRLQKTFASAGAELLSFTQQGTRLIVDWRLLDGDFRYNSVIDSRTFMVTEAGYCCTGADKKFNPTALIKTAEEYEQRGVVHLTRH